MKSPQPASPLKPNDAFSLVSATQNGNPLPVWDGGWGKIYLVWDNCGYSCHPIGAVRARNWEEAYEIAVDEIFPGPDAGELAEYDAACATVTDDNYPELPEGWQYRGSGTPSNQSQFPHIHSLYAVSSLDISNPIKRATPAELVEHNIRLVYSL